MNQISGYHRCIFNDLLIYKKRSLLYQQREGKLAYTYMTSGVKTSQ